MPYKSKEARRAYLSQWRENNRAKVREIQARYRARNLDKVRVRAREWHQKRYAEDINFRLRVVVRARLRAAIKTNQKSTIDHLGCSIPELRLYLENYFPLYQGMSWANYGTEWEIDHFFPLAKFNLADQMDLREACHFTNLQPMWKSDNRRKRDNDPTIPVHGRQS